MQLANWSRRAPGSVLQGPGGRGRTGRGSCRCPAARRPARLRPARRSLRPARGTMNHPFVALITLVFVLGCQLSTPAPTLAPTEMRSQTVPAPETTATLEPTATRIPLPISTSVSPASVSSRSGFPVSQERDPNPSEADGVGFGLKEFPHFPVAAIVRISTPTGAGSGFIFLTRDDTAFVMTNAHVLSQSPITVRVRNAEEYEAVFLGSDSIVDIAVVSICCSDSFEEIPLEDGLKITNPVPWSDNTDSAWTGDPLVVVGYPRGSYDLVASSGKIHTILDTASGTRVVHDAAAEPGNSGSPILSPDGRLMGVHFAGSIWGDTYSFVVPFDEAAYWASRWTPRADPPDPRDAAVPAYQGDVIIRFINGNEGLLLAAASKAYVQNGALLVEIGYGHLSNLGAMVDRQIFYDMGWLTADSHENLRADSFSVRLVTVTDGTIGSVPLECKRSTLSDERASLFACSKP